MRMGEYIKPFEGPLEQFPEDEELPEGVKCIRLKDTYGPYGTDFRMMVYAERDHEQLKVGVLMPVEGNPNDPQRTYPLIVFVQGSAFHRQFMFDHMPTMLRVCEKGFAVAFVQYRPSEVAPFPAQTQDAKTAIRFLKMHAGELRINPDRIALWGDSSGAHTAVMAGITGDGVLDTELYNRYSCSVRCIVDWYGPTDISRMNEQPSTQDHAAAESPEGFLIGRRNVLENPKLAAATVPMNYLSADRPTPPILIMHGSRDHLVCFRQSCLLYEKLRSLGKDVEMYKVMGAYHAFGGFLSDEAADIVLEFIRRKLGE